MSEGVLGDWGPTLAYTLWEYDHVNEYRVWVKIKSRNPDFNGQQMQVNVTSNLQTKAGKTLKMQTTKFRFHSFCWTGVFHVTHITALPPVITFRIELSEDDTQEV